MGEAAAALSDEQILNQLGALVSDCLQVVSYKWLSRKFSIHSSRAKRLLQMLASKNGCDLEVVYAISGWTDPQQRNFSVQLVSRNQLEEAKNAFVGPASCHVYSLQPSLPKDPAELWSSDFVQAEELFNQPLEVNNCLRDNRFSAIACPLVTRVTGRKKPQVVSAAPARPSAATAKESVPPRQAKRTSVASVKAEKKESSGSVIQEQQSVAASALHDASKTSPERKPGLLHAVAGEAKESNEKQQPPPLKATSAAGAAGKGKALVASGSGASLANLWGRASIKPKAEKSSPGKTVPHHAVIAEARLQSMEAAHEASSDDDDVADFARIRRGSVRRRQPQVIIHDDSSDGENEGKEEAISLASPGTRKKEPELAEITASLEKRSSPVTVEAAERLEECPRGQEGKRPVVDSQHMNDESTSNANSEDAVGEAAGKLGVKRESEADSIRSPCELVVETSSRNVDMKKRRLIKKTIDEHGREVYEAVGVSEQAEKLGLRNEKRPETAPAHPNLPSKQQIAAASVGQQPKHAPKVGSRSGGKTTSKGPQKGNLYSFFKKV